VALAVGGGALAVGVMAAALALTAGDASDPDTSPPAAGFVPEIVIVQNASSLVRYGDCDAVLAYLKQEGIERVGPYGLTDRYPFLLEGDVGVRLAPVASATQVARPDGLATGGDQGFSKTNTQEVDVDEPDLVETDGQRLYDVRGGVLRTVDIAAREVAGTLDLHLVNVRGAMLVGDQLVVLADEPLTDARGGEAKVVVVDVAGDPEVSERLTIDGLLVDARVADGRVHVVTQNPPALAFTYPTELGMPGAEDAATEANKERIRTSTLEDWLPSRTVTDGDGNVTAERALLTDCAAIRHPKEFGGFDQTSLVTLDLADLASSASTSVQASSLLVYGSADSLYTATTTYQELDALTRGRPFAGDPGTDIHRFVLGDAPVYAGSGHVEGYVNGQFGLSEHDGHLRVASSTFAGTPQNRVTVLRVDEGALLETGLVDGLGPNEQIQGVRFLGDMGYVVTFRQIDPLYVVDLRDPTAPALAGELEMPGYSAYLHPVGDGEVLGVGFDGSDGGALTGAAASLFDVRDPARPMRADLEAFGENTTPKTDDDHHAFTWWDETRTAFIPVGLFAAGHRVEVVRVADGTLTKVGAILPEGEGAPTKAAFDRIVMVGDQVLSVSPEGVQVSDRESLEPVAWIDYP
jgi:uncharacterized secreted protein with C-terminal beta-propeller domain